MEDEGTSISESRVRGAVAGWGGTRVGGVTRVVVGHGFRGVMSLGGSWVGGVVSSGSPAVFPAHEGETQTGVTDPWTSRTFRSSGGREVFEGV